MLVVMNITAKVSFFIYFGEIVRKTLGLVKYFTQVSDLEFKPFEHTL